MIQQTLLSCFRKDYCHISANAIVLFRHIIVLFQQIPLSQWFHETLLPCFSKRYCHVSAADTIVPYYQKLLSCFSKHYCPVSARYCRFIKHNIIVVFQHATVIFQQKLLSCFKKHHCRVSAQSEPIINV